MLSASTTSTLANLFSRTIDNRGTIENSGAGAAIEGRGIVIINAANARIASAGATAISSDNYLLLTNAGTIVGDVLTGNSGNFVDSTAGQITGSLRFGTGNDTLIGTFDGTRISYGVDGTIDGGTGTDLARIRVTADATLSAPLTLPTGFEQLSLAPDTAITATLDSGFSTPGTLFVSGYGTILNRTTLSGTGQILRSEFQDSRSPYIINAGTIVSTSTSDLAAIDLSTVNLFENRGTITAVRNAVDVSIAGSVVNSGTITAGNTAVYLFGEKFTNTVTGVLRSTGGVALEIRGSIYSTPATNAGLIEGITGARIGVTFANTGTITGNQTGMFLTGPATFENRAGGIVSGGNAIVARDSSEGFFTNNATIVNAGTIAGNVVLGNNQAQFYSNNNRFIALPGGVLNGDLILGQDNTLVTELVNTGSGAFAGITGNVIASDSNLRLRVRSDASATLTTPAGFSEIGYELFDNAALTLTGPATTMPVLLAGSGSVDLNANITTTAASAIRISGLSQYSTDSPTSLTITSRGALSLTRAESVGYGSASVVSLGGRESFTNLGTITAINLAPAGYGETSAITSGLAFGPPYRGGTQVTNAGTIILGGATGISGPPTIINTGSIVQAEGARASTGIYYYGGGNPATLTNSGTIDVAGIAVQGTYGTLAITNSGRIASSGNVGIAVDSGFGLTIDNSATGTIAGRVDGLAIRTGGGKLTNAGTITGGVDLGYNQYGGRAYGDATYVTDGGTIDGDLLFGRSDDTLVAFGALGVSGTIDGGEGADTLVVARRASDTVTLGFASVTNFEALGVRALGTDTIVTARADAKIEGDLRLSGDGQIVNTASIDGNVLIYNPSFLVDGIYQSGPVLSAFTNQDTITGAVTGTTNRFVNSGSIGSETQGGSTVQIDALGSLSFINGGRILAAADERAVRLEGYRSDTIDAVNSGTITGSVQADIVDYPWTDNPRSNPVAIAFTNTGTVSATDLTVRLLADIGSDVAVSLTLANSGTIEATGTAATAASLTKTSQGGGVGTVTVTNSGTISANGGGRQDEYYDWFSDTLRSFTLPSVALDLANGWVSQAQVNNSSAGVIEAVGERSVALLSIGAALDLTNAGLIRGSAGTALADDDGINSFVGRPYLAGAIQTGLGDDRIVNTGSIVGSVDLGIGNDRIDNLGRIEGNVFLGEGDDTFLQRASAVTIGTVDAGAGTDTFIVDATGGGTVNGDQFVNFERFSQTGSGSVSYTGNFRLNTIDLIGGTIGVAAGQTLTSDGPFTITGSDAIETVENDGTIAGGVTLGAGNDRVVNRGTIGGAVLLGEGDDSFVEGANSRVAGGVDGGSGTDTYGVVLAGNRSGINARTGFERLSLEGTGTLALALDQSFEAVTLTGTGLSATLGGFSLGTVTGSDAAEQLMVDGDVASVALGAGNDMLALGTQLAAGRYDGGMGSDTLAFTNAGPVTLLGTANGFEQVALIGGALNVAGTLGSAGTSLSFGDGAQSVTVASGGTLAGVVDLGAGNDSLTFATQTVTGSYDGGAGSDTLAFTNAGPVTLSGTATGFEQVALTNGALTVAGTLGTVNVPLSFGDGAQSLTVASGGTLTGIIDLGAGNDALRLAGTLNGTVAGGAGSDTATLVLTGDRSLASTTLTGFETFTSEGTGTLTLTGTHAYDTVNAGTSLTIASGSTLTAPQVRFDSGDQRFTIAGGFTGAVDGGAGSDTLAITGGNTAFSTVTNVEALAMSGGFATVSGTATLGSVDLTGGRLVGLAGSVLNGTFAVRSGATFGSAGTVNGNVTVAGILSPGASPGTMTVNGNVSLASGSTSVFEFTPTAQDKLVINGTLAIASGSTLQLTQSGTLRPGASYDLITASGGITGSFTTIQKPDTLFGFVVQRTDRIQLLGQFLNDAGFSPQVSRSVAYANTVLQTQPATSALFAVLPALTTSNGASNPQAFARLTPEAYATATQAGVENALALTDIARGPGFAPNRSEPGGFTFGQAIGSWYRLAADADTGVSRARTTSYGFVGGVGYGDSSWSVGVFGGYLNSRQRIDTLAARSDIDGWVAGVHGRYEAGNFGFGASIAYNAGQANTDRTLPASVASRASYDLNSLVSDLSAHYTIDMGDWALRPRAGVTYVRTARDRLVEAGGPFALTVAADRHVAGFADAGVGFARAETSDAAFRPFVSLGVRYQIEGQRTDAVAGYAGGPLGLVALGAGRAQAVGTVSAGLVQRVTDGLDLFSTVSAQTGKDDHREAISTGVRLRF
ncbi:autotransporter outer membrane beta-barrel domain-containing protein [Sphingomonas sp. SAFR-052]|uniref:autotransporter outer membrane beta-barrel domain-containing protein n=1 Tax=Sphingomonas sp. SAFR-052 TaxID=3436867 RepID=UPI003F80387B